MTESFLSILPQVKSASLADAMGRHFDHQYTIEGLVSPTPGRVLFGRAVTINFIPVRDDIQDPQIHNFASLLYKAIGDSGKGKVLVMASNGHESTSLGGGTKSSRLRNHDLSGLLTDGSLRDFDELSNYDFATYCSGETVNWGGGTVMPFAANVEVVVDGVTILPGDYIYADGAAAVVIPANSVEKIFEEALKVEAEDVQALEQIKREDPEEIREKGSSEN